MTNAYLSFILLLFVIKGYTQNSGTVYYYKTSNYKNLGYLGVNESSTSVNETINKMLFELKFNDSLAVYKKVNTKKNEDELSILLSGYKGVSHYHLNNKKIIYRKGKYLIEKAFNDFKWVISEQSKIIDGLLCYKATSTIEVMGRRRRTSKEVTAWFTPDICISGGPSGFSGLPGLIVELKIDRVTTKIKKINFSEKNTIIKLPTGNKVITEEEFNTHIDKISY